MVNRLQTQSKPWLARLARLAKLTAHVTLSRWFSNCYGHCGIFKPRLPPTAHVLLYEEGEVHH